MNQSEELKDWDARFWAPSKDLCDACMPPGLSQEIQRNRDASPGPVGSTGGSRCAKCGGPR